MSLVRKGILLSAADKYATQALGVATMVVMARILTPAETGLYLIANSLIVLSDQFRAFGVGVYIVQERELDRAAVRAGFTVTLALSLATGAAIWAASGAIAAFYGDPELARLLRIAALAFVATPFASPIVALLQRELAFATLAGLNIAGAVVGFGVTVGLGIAGFGPASYLWGFVATSASVALLAFAARPETWLFRPSLARAGRVISFGLTSSAITLVNMACDMLPRLAFGKTLGFDAVGLYARALTVCQLPDRAIGAALHPVVLPAMTAEARGRGDLKSIYLHGLRLMTAAQWPALILLALLADPAVRILLGPQWGEAAPLVRIVAMASMALAPALMTFPVLVSVGRVRDALVVSLISLPPSAALVIAAAHFGLTAAAASLFVTAPFQMVVALVYVRRAIGLTWGEILAAVRASVAVTVGAAAPPTLVILLSPDGFALGWAETAVAACGAAVGWIAAAALVGHPMLGEVRAVAGMAADFRARRRAARASRA